VKSYETQLANLNGQLKEALDLQDAEAAVKIQKAISSAEQGMETAKADVENVDAPEDDPQMIGTRQSLR
jgi:hypothetical protein